MADSKELIAVNIEDEMRASYLDYAMSVIVGRALPDVRDGLKPVHRRILYAMYREGLLSNRRYSKCAGVVGEVLKKYHPHGDSAVYDALVRMAQEWNMRYMLIDGQGNFGSVDGDSAAAYRYTECRLKALSEEMMADIDKNTVDFVANFDDSTQEPAVLPTKVPNLLINGSDGIAVGMATKIPPHNLGEIIDGLLALIQNPNLSDDKLIEKIPGPDFPTGAQIVGHKGILQAYKTGRGILTLRAKAEIEPMAKKADRDAIIVTELPFQVNKARLIESIANLVNQEKIEGISEIRDESDRHGMRIVIELKKGMVSNVVLNQLYKHTALQSSFGIILLTIVKGQPQILSLKKILQLFLDHRKVVITRRTLFELDKAKKRAHILEGLKIAVENIDEVIAIIKAAKNPSVAKDQLMAKFELSEVQAQAILEMRLARLTGLERDKIIAEYKEVLALIAELEKILADENLIFGLIKSELKEIRKKYADERRTEIVAGDVSDFTSLDLIQKEQVVVTVTHEGFVKRNPIDTYRSQKRGGRGKSGAGMRDTDFIEHIFITNTHDYFLVFSNLGRVYWLRVHHIPEMGRTAKGRAIANLISLERDEKVSAILPVSDFKAEQAVMFATKNGKVKKTDLEAYSRPRSNGIIAIKLEDSDELIGAVLCDPESDILVASRKGISIRFRQDDIRSMGRVAAGVRGMKLSKTDEVVSLRAITSESMLLAVSEKGYGKRTKASEYRIQGRGGSGIITMKSTTKTGEIVGVASVTEDDDLMLISNQGKIIRLKAKEISIIGRNTQGVKLINLANDERVVAIAKLANEEEATEEGNEAEE